MIIYVLSIICASFQNYYCARLIEILTYRSRTKTNKKLLEIKFSSIFQNLWQLHSRSLSEDWGILVWWNLQCLNLLHSPLVWHNFYINSPIVVQFVSDYWLLAEKRFSFEQLLLWQQLLNLRQTRDRQLWLSTPTKFNESPVYQRLLIHRI